MEPPIRLRLMCVQERLGYFYFSREVGRRMNIQDVPTNYELFEEFNREYERQHYRFTETNHRVGLATRELFVSWAPQPVGPVIRAAIHALLDDPLIDAFGFPRPLYGSSLAGPSSSATAGRRGCDCCPLALSPGCARR